MRKWKWHSLSLLQKLLLYAAITISIPMIGFGHFSISSTRTLLKERAIIEEADSVALAAESINNTMRNLMLYLLELYQDETLLEISNAMSAKDSPQELQKYYLSFTNTVETKLQLDRVYKLDMKLYTMLFQNENRYFLNYTADISDMQMYQDRIQQFKSKNPYMVSWIGLLNNYDAYRYKDEGYLLSLGIPMDAKRKDSPVLLIGVLEKAIREQLFPNGILQDENRFLVDENMQVLSSGHAEYIGRNLADLVEIDVAAMQTTESGQIPDVETEDGKAVLVYQKLESAPWRVVGIKSNASIVAAVTEANEKRISFGIVWALLSLIIAIYTIKRVTEPLKELSEKMVAYHLGDAPNDETPKHAGKEVYQIYQCYNDMIKNISDLSKENEWVQEEKRAMELQLLQTQIKPHFLFNTLMSIRCAIENGNQQKAADMTLALSKFLRNTIVKGAEVIRLKDEIEIIRTYIQVTNYRSYQKFELRLEVDESLLEMEIPKLLLQPLIENAIKHGFSEMERGEIVLKVKRQNQKIEIRVCDNGGGFEKNPLEYCTGKEHFGVYSVYHRLKLYYGSKGKLYYVSNHGTEAVILLPETKCE